MRKLETVRADCALTTEEWFGEGVVTWAKAPTASDARTLTGEKIKRLLRKPRSQLRPDYSQLQIADSLASCEASWRCLDGACPTCGRALQRWLTHNITAMASSENRTMVALSLIPAVALDTTVTGATLGEAFADACRHVASVAVVEWAVLGLDVSYNDFTQIAGRDWKGAQEGWQPHVHGVVCVRNLRAADELKAALKDLFPASQTVLTPVYGRIYDGRTYWASYICKFRFQRRVSYFDTETGTLNTAPYNLSAEHDVTLMRALSDLGLSGRTCLIGLQAVEVESEDKISLVLTPVNIG